MHRPPSAAELTCFRRLAVAYIPLQLTKSLSIVILHLIWTDGLCFLKFNTSFMTVASSRSLGPQPVGVQYPLTSSLSDFPGDWDWLWYPGLPLVLNCWCPSPFPLLLPYLGIFPFTLLHLTLNLIRVSSLRPTLA